MTAVDVAVAEAVDVAVRDAVADDVAVRLASRVDAPVAVSVTDGVSDGPGVTVASSTTIVPVIPAEVEVDRWIYGGWDGHLCGKTPHNFDIEGGKGYLAKLTKPSRWSVS
ncbi:MAG: hypothetical protein EBT09_01540 [Actinobacteria bacterium]|nr:hypothetical protein [Actinomycetota bacterium]